MKCEVNPKVNKWLLSQPWIGQFIDNLKNCWEPDDMLLFLLGGEGKETINIAFLWEGSPEGKDFWSNKHLELVKLWEENKWNKSTVCIEI